MTGRRIWKIIGTSVTAVFVFMFLVGGSGQFWILSAIWTLVSGWLTYPARVLPQVTLNPEMILCGIGALGLALYFGHRFLKWLAENIKFLPSPWGFRYTACLSFLVLSMFGTSIAMTGIVHQAAWLARGGSMAKQRGMSEGAVQMSRAKSLSSYLGLAVRKGDDGSLVYPASIHLLYTEGRFAAHLCPYQSGGDAPWLFPAAAKTVSDFKTPVFVSPRPNREGKIVVLFPDGKVDSFPADELPPEVAAVFQ